ncbi:MAG: anthranilate synthase component I family protein [Verrucomicrobia bacterium]|nr:anthranilate synthase component I family protein [Verrucomicrobiota bacterium]MBU6446362.1 anthranilate synthase component I family protein [Verrucomicrobiota bacterium]MDE3047884.1 anthranilate synthase component I family protein [Verrucomicrobiota bacterium]
MKTKEIPYDQFTPITAFYALGGQCILESSPGKDRYSFVGVDPIESIQGQGDYAHALRAMQTKYRTQGSVLFMGGPVGYVGYDNRYFFQVFRTGLLFDHNTGKALLATLGDEAELQKQYTKLMQPQMLPKVEFEVGPIEVDRSDDAFKAMIAKAKEHLQAGDIFQIVLSRTFKMTFQGDPLQFYRALRRSSPAPFLFYFNFGSHALAGASPEKVISVHNGIIESTPIAGTCPKDGSIEALLADLKENAEHVMLVDLARNDVGKVAKPGTVKVVEYKVAHEFSHVKHIVSKVVGELAPQFDALDAFTASFPAGTLTGAPKTRAMELIREIEQDDRGIYGGAIVALDGQGNLASCIAIRTALFQDGEMRVRAGAGIVIDSEPQKEADETYHKASTILEVAHAFNH